MAPVGYTAPGRDAGTRAPITTGERWRQGRPEDARGRGEGGTVSGNDGIDEVVREFVAESHENLDRIDGDLLALERDPSAKQAIASIFRTFHTIKGTCGFLGFGRLERLTHSAETLLSRCRDGELVPNTEFFNVLLALVDTVRGVLASIESTGAEPDVDHSALVARIEATARSAKKAESRRPKSVAPAGRLSSPPPSPGVLAGTMRSSAASKGSASNIPPAMPRPAAMPFVDEIVVPRVDVPGVSVGRLMVPAAPPAPAQGTAAAAVAAKAPEVPAPAAPRNSMAPAAPEAHAVEGAPEARGLGLPDGYVRVDVAVLDRLMDLVGELVLTRNQTLQFAATQSDPNFLAASQRLNLITTDLQEGVMRTRMQPIGNVLTKLPRMVRDLAMACGRKVRLEVEGTDTELDRTVIEAVKDPLTHIVRNAIDHGLEAPDVRVKAGKPAEGVVSLRAFHEGGMVNIEIADDGAGVRPDKVRARAIERGLVSRDDAGRMSDHDLVNLLFLPGFSTAETVTNVSGRGVGMDVVKTNVEQIGGTVALRSVLGRGTTVEIKIPLTLAIIPALVVSSCGERYAIPQVSLLELVRVEREQAARAIETVFGARLYRLRDKLLPLIDLRATLDDGRLAGAEGETDGAMNILVLEAQGRPFGLVVDEIHDTQEIVVKPLGALLKSLSLFAGATILGDGGVALILDVMGLAERAHLLGENRDKQKSKAAATQATKALEPLLLFGVPGGGRMAVALSQVARLEEFPAAALERTGDGEVVQYRGDIMPVQRLSAVIPERRRTAREVEAEAEAEGARDRVPVVVFDVGGERFGLLVDRIHDVVEEDLAGMRPGTRRGVRGSMVLQGKVTELLDVRCLAPSAVARGAEA